MKRDEKQLQEKIQAIQDTMVCAWWKMEITDYSFYLWWKQAF